MNTKELILQEALKMFSNQGYDSVSIRDIAKTVNIKESSIYYHFKNKQDIVDSLVSKFEGHLNMLVEKLNEAIVKLAPNDSFSPISINAYYFDQYLFDPFCNQMLRFIMLEQFHNNEMVALYDKYLFELPYKYQVGVFETLGEMGIMNKEQALFIGNAYYAEMTMLTFKYILNGELTEDKKSKFKEEVNTYMKSIFGGRN